MSITEYTKVYVLDKGSNSRTDLSPSGLKTYVTAVESLIQQIELGKYVDENGHLLTDNVDFKAVKDL